MAGSSDAYTDLGVFSQINTEYINDRRPTFTERVREVTGHWRFLLQAYRAVRTDPILRSNFHHTKPHIQNMSYSPGHQDLLREFIGCGVSARAISRQPTTVYTLQLAAYRSPGAPARLLAQLPRGDIKTLFEGAQIYTKTSKRFRLDYGDDSLWFKTEPLYLTRHNGLTRLRFGIYENPADAASDAAVWTQRYGLRPINLRTQLTPRLVRHVLWDDLPGVYTGPPRRQSRSE